MTGQSPARCEVDFDDNLLELVSTQVVDGELQVHFLRSVSSNQPLRLRLATEHLHQVTISGAAHGVIENLNEPSLAFQVSGSAEIRCSGNAKELTLNASGASKFDCEELIANDVKIKVSGSGDAIVHAVDSLSVNISGSGSVQYLGNPEINKQVSGSARSSIRSKQPVACPTTTSVQASAA